MTAGTPLYLLLDQGGHASRALICDLRGRVLSQAHCPLVPAVSGEHWEYDARRLLESVQRAAHEAVASLGPAHRRRLRAAALATQRSNVACWDRRRGRPLAPVIAWQDRRAQALLDALPAGARRRIRRLTGLFPSPHYGAGKLRWCLDHLSAVRKAHADGTLALGPMAAFLAQALTGSAQPLADPVNASRTLLWDLRRRRWSPALLRLFDLPQADLPACVPSCHDFGSLPVAGLTLPLRLVTGDQAAAPFAWGKPDPQVVHITLGTGAFLLRPTGNALRLRPGLLGGILHDDGNKAHYALEGTVNGAGNALRGYQAATGRAVNFARLDRLPPPAEHAPLFLNGVGGLGTPFMQARFPSRFIGDGRESWEERLAAVLESILFLLQLNLERLIRAGPTPERIPARIELGGGLSRLDSFSQRLADLSGLPVRRCRHHETTALGLLGLLAAADGLALALPAAEVFQPRENAVTRRRYRRWKHLLYDALNNDALNNNDLESDRTADPIWEAQ